MLGRVCSANLPEQHHRIYVVIQQKYEKLLDIELDFSIGPIYFLLLRQLWGKT